MRDLQLGTGWDLKMAKLEKARGVSRLDTIWGGKTNAKEEEIMVKFYDAKNEADLARVLALLHKGGIEYFLTQAPAGAVVSLQIEVAEEDVPKAEEILQGVSKV